MRQLTFITLLSLAFTSQYLTAEESHCETKLFKYLQGFEKNSLSLPKRDPQGDLATLAERYEILCPWSLEGDLNGDRKTDWAGVVYRDHKYQLVIYLSQTVSFKPYILQTYKKFPKDTFIQLIRIKDIIAKSGNSSLLSPAKYGIVAKQLSGTSNIYLWTKDQMAMVYDYPDDTVIEEESSLGDNIDEPEDSLFEEEEEEIE